MTTSDQGRWMITRLEGVELRAYQDAIGLWTIGVGHLLTDEERRSGQIRIGGQYVDWRNGLTASQVDTLLSQDLASAEACVGSLPLALHQRQFDALVSWVFNVGEGNARKSTLWRRFSTIADEINRTAASELIRWDKAGGRRLTGLVHRRRSEIEMFTGKVDETRIA